MCTYDKAIRCGSTNAHAITQCPDPYGCGVVTTEKPYAWDLRMFNQKKYEEREE